MIIEFKIMMVAPDIYQVTAVMFDEPSITVGMFDEDEIDEACEQFLAEHKRQLH